MVVDVHVAGELDAPASHREKDGNYRGEIVRSGRYRVAVCKDGIQWLLQYRRNNEECARARWKECRVLQDQGGLNPGSGPRLRAAPVKT